VADVPIHSMTSARSFRGVARESKVMARDKSWGEKRYAGVGDGKFFEKELGDSLSTP